jgi:hypothetical protein
MQNKWPLVNAQFRSAVVNGICMTTLGHERDEFLLGADEDSPEVTKTNGVELPELLPSPWRSLGKRLDYSNWPDRERFVELDAAILAKQELLLQCPIRCGVQSEEERLLTESGSVRAAA